MPPKCRVNANGPDAANHLKFACSQCADMLAALQKIERLAMWHCDDEANPNDRSPRT